MAQKSYYWNGTNTPYVGASWRGFAYPAVQHAKEVSDDMSNYIATTPVSQGVELAGPKIDIPIWMWVAGAAAGYYHFFPKKRALRTNPRRRRRSRR